jgi:hypothetical protein
MALTPGSAGPTNGPTTAAGSLCCADPDARLHDRPWTRLAPTDMGAQLGDETCQPKTRPRRRGRISVEPGCEKSPAGTPYQPRTLGLVGTTVVGVGRGYACES